MSNVNSQAGQVKVEEATFKGLCGRLEESVAEYEDHYTELQGIRDHLLGATPGVEATNKQDTPAGMFGGMERLLNRFTRCNRHCVNVIADLSTSIGMEVIDPEDS